MTAIHSHAQLVWDEVRKASFPIRPAQAKAVTHQESRHVDKSRSPTATVREIDGQLVLDDPDARAMIAAIGKVNCSKTLEAQRERVEYFKGRIVERGLSPADIVIVLLNVDDEHGGAVADVLMPLSGAMWDEMRARGEVPFARGLAARGGITEIVRELDPGCAQKLEALGTAVVVMDHGVIEVFEA